MWLLRRIERRIGEVEGRRETEKKEKENLRGDEGYSQNIEQKGKKKRFTK